MQVLQVGGDRGGGDVSHDVCVVEHIVDLVEQALYRLRQRRHSKKEHGEKHGVVSNEQFWGGKENIHAIREIIHQRGGQVVEVRPVTTSLLRSSAQSRHTAGYIWEG